MLRLSIKPFKGASYIAIAKCYLFKLLELKLNKSVLHLNKTDAGSGYKLVVIWGLEYRQRLIFQLLLCMAFLLSSHLHAPSDLYPFLLSSHLSPLHGNQVQCRLAKFLKKKLCCKLS